MGWLDRMRPQAPQPPDGVETAERGVGEIMESVVDDVRELVGAHVESLRGDVASSVSGLGATIKSSLLAFGLVIVTAVLAGISLIVTLVALGLPAWAACWVVTLAVAIVGLRVIRRVRAHAARTGDAVTGVAGQLKQAVTR